MNKWIDITEEAPSEKQEIIVYFKNSAGWHVTAAWWNGLLVCELCSQCQIEKPWGAQYLITHWMSLPKPPLTA